MIEEHCAVNFPLTRLADLVKGYPFSLVLVQAPVLGLKSDGESVKYVNMYVCLYI